MKLDENDIKYLAAAFKSLKEQIKVIGITAISAAHGSAIALKVLEELTDKDTINKATKEVGEEVGREAAKAQKKDPLSPGEAFKKYGGM